MTRLTFCILLVLSGFAYGEEKKDLPIKIYVLVGQSNMEGKGGIGTLKGLVDNDPNKEYQFLVDEKGGWIKRKDVWIHYKRDKAGLRFGSLEPGYGSSDGLIGPELSFGHKMGDAYEGQVLIIKTAWGGKSLGRDFLPPSIGKYPTPKVPKDPGYYYHLALQNIDEVLENIETFFPDYQGQGIEFAGIGFHQGWNDQYGMQDQYENNLAAFIKDIRSEEHGLGVPNLPFVIATSGMIEKKSLVKDGQKAMADAKKYPEFVGNVAVVDTDQPYGPDKMKFKFYTEQSPDKVGYHWNNHAGCYTNIGRAMASEMKKLKRPAEPSSRMRAFGTKDGVKLTWQLGTEMPKKIALHRNGKLVSDNLPVSKIVYFDKDALPGKNSYQLVLDMPNSPKKLLVSIDTSVSELSGFRSPEGVMLNWKARGKYTGFKLTRDGKVIADNLSPESRSYEDTTAPEEGKVEYAIVPLSGEVTPAKFVFNLGPLESGGAVIYEPFDYPAVPGEYPKLIGQNRALGTKGTYTYKDAEKNDRAASVHAGGLSYGSLPVTGNHGFTHRHCKETVIQLDDSLKNAGLLEDGATLWISYLFFVESDVAKRGGGGISLRTEDLKEGIGFDTSERQGRTIVFKEGEKIGQKMCSVKKGAEPRLVAGKITWGKDGEEDTFVPYFISKELTPTEMPTRAQKPFQIDQSKLSLLVLEGLGLFDEIRVGPTFESVVGGGK